LLDCSVLQEEFGCVKF